MDFPPYTTKNLHVSSASFRTTETIARFIQPLLRLQQEVFEETPNWVATLTAKMARSFSTVNRRIPIDLENTTLTANSGRIYFEQLHLHPVRLGLTFTQEWLDHHEASDTVMVFQFIRGMVRLSLYFFHSYGCRLTMFADFPTGVHSECSTCVHFLRCGPCV